MDTPQDTPDTPTTAAPKRLISKSEILGKRDTQYRDVPIPEWDGTARVRSITGSERDAWEQSLIRERKSGKGHETNLKNARASLCVLALVDDEGKRVFEDTDAPILSTKNAAAIDRVYEVAAALSKISDRDVEELLGNSDSARTAGQ